MPNALTIAETCAKYANEIQAEDIVVLESEGRAGIPVRAQSSAAWLTLDREITVTGSTLELRAEPLLAPDQATSFAEVQISGLDPSVANTVTIKPCTIVTHFDDDAAALLPNLERAAE